MVLYMDIVKKAHRAGRMGRENRQGERAVKTFKEMMGPEKSELDKQKLIIPASGRLTA
jgi:hypothetical protein